MDSKELLEKAKQAYYNVQHKEYTKRSFIAGYLIGYAEQLRQYNVIESLSQDNFCKVCNLPTDGEKCYSKRCSV